MIRNLTKRHPL